jgi:hypothetical protein|tara:strand:- start:272 stop:475 length:204 start_codon:yes stop_codon:yes gene_type:complete
MNNIKQMLSEVEKQLQTIHQHNHTARMGKNKWYRLMGSMDCMRAINDLKKYLSFIQRKLEGGFDEDR